MKIETKDGGQIITKTQAAEVIKSDADGDLVLLVSTQNPDSDGDIIYQMPNKKGAGWVLDRFNRAPVITWQHNLAVPNLSGSRTRAKVKTLDGKGPVLLLDPLQFDEGDPFAMALDGKYRRGVLVESSVGFYTRETDPRMVEGQRVGLHIYESELIETAAVNRGANPETDTLAKSILKRCGSAVETAGDAEAKDLIQELDALRDTVSFLTNEVKLLGDKVDKEPAALKLDEMTAHQTKAAEALLATLARVGTAKS